MRIFLTRFSSATLTLSVLFEVLYEGLGDFAFGSELLELAGDYLHVLGRDVVDEERVLM
jgi:hypothetical protein